MKYIQNNGLYLLLVTFLVVFLFYAYQANNHSLAYDFSEKSEQASAKKLLGEGQEQPKEQQDEQQQGEQQPKEETKREQESDDKPQQTDTSQQKPEIIQQAENKTPDAPGATEQPTDNKEANVIEVTEDATEENRYFTTNLVNGQTVTESTYYVTLTHLDASLQVQQLDVTLNKQLLENYTGELQFEEGTNSVAFEVTYVKENGQVVSAKQQYEIVLNTKQIIVFTNLKNATVEQQELAFTASAKLKAENVAIDVTVNGKALAPLAGVAYSVKLEEGNNTITIKAEKDGQSVSERYDIVYEEPKALIELDTSLSEHQATEPQYTFYVKATANREAVPLKVLFNDEPITGNAENQYVVTLQHGVNNVQVTGAYKAEKLVMNYRILYKDPAVVEEVTIDAQAPKLVTDLKDGTKVKGDIKTINVWPTTASGERIRGKNVIVKVNGTGIPFTWDDSVKTSYKLVLQPGENKVSIKVWDNDGRAVTENFIVHSEQVEDSGVIGQATISVEASTLGIKYLIPPTKVDIHKGEKGSFVIDQLLRNHGFSYDYTGTMTTGFYLKEISKRGMLNNLSIPDDLWALVEKHSTRSNRDDYSTDTVGEFDFANGSGWMYSVNGDYPNYGLSDAYFLDGDVVRIRYTLHYGKDIGGFEGLGGATDSEWTKQW